MIPVIGLLIGGVVLKRIWGSVIEWLRTFVAALKKAWEKVKPLVPHGVRICGDLIMEGTDFLCRIMHKLYYRKGKDWIEKTTVCEVSEDEVPEEIRRKLSMDKQTDITREMERELQLTV